MHINKVGVAMFIAGTGVAAALIASPQAIADSCDPSVTVCQGNEVQPGSDQLNATPPVPVADDQYPDDADWYFNPAGGSTPLQHDQAGSGSGGGGGHR
jgi:hypothetical protein